MSDEMAETIAEYVSDFANHELVDEGYEPAQIAFAEAMLMLYRSLRVLQMMDESGHGEWMEMSREEVESFASTTSAILGLTPGDKASEDAVLAFVQFRSQELRDMEYSEYLKTPEWKDVRRFAIHLAGGRCENCNRPSSLQVHHRDYSRRGHERLQDVRVLCAGCHEVFHRERGMPWRNA